MSGLELKTAVRVLRLNPGFAIVAIVSLALGAGANTAIFQLLDAIRLRTLPVQAPGELVELRIEDMTHARGNWLRDTALTNPLWEEIRKRQQVFSGIFAWADESFNISPNGEVRQVRGLWVSGDFFRVLGVGAVLGRVFTPADDRRGCGGTPGAVISYGFWQGEFGGDPSVIGRKVGMGENAIEVIGVTPPAFFGLEVGRTFDIALPLCSEAVWHGANGRLDSGTTWWLTVIGRLKPGLSRVQAGVRFQSISTEIFQATLPADYPPASVKPYLAMKLLAIPAGSGVSRLRERYSTPLGLLLAIGGFVLLIACANLANLMLARANARQREIAVRLAVGASRARVVQQLMVEGLLLAVAGTGLGLLLAQALSRFLVSFLSTGDNPQFVDLRLDWRIFGFTAALSVLTCLLFALTPALRLARTEPGRALKSGGRSLTSGREGVGLRRALVASQIALSLVLSVCALLFVRSLRNLMTLDPGFQEHGILVADINFRTVHLPPGRAVSFRREILERIRAIPGVEATAEVTVVPLTGRIWNNRMWMNGSDLDHARVCLRSMVGTEYFRTMQIPLIAGREFDEHDLGSLSKVALVNEAFARTFTGSGVNAVGRRFWIEATPFDPETAYEIAGVVRNSKYVDLREEFQPVVFLPISRAVREQAGIRIMIRSNARPDALVSSVRNALGTINPNIQYSFHVFDKWIQESLLREQLVATLSGLFGVLAIVLTVVGLYGVISYTVAQRTNEIGIRMALGADRRAVIVLILREAGIVLAAGLGSGTVLALAAGRSAAALLFGLESYDPLTLGMAGVAVTAVAAAASYLPVWRAANVNPLTALRHE